MLRAKSPLRSGEIISLERHLRETEQAAMRIFRLDGRWGRNWCRFFQIQGTEAQETFLLNLRVAALFHDIGKANEDFYSAVCGASRIVQTLRHDHLGALILHLPDVRLWLSKNSALDAEVITASVLSHHLKAAPDGDFWRWCQPRGLKKEISLYLGHSEVTSVFRHIGEIASLSEPPELSVAVWSERAPWAEAYRSGRRDALQFGRQLQSNKGRLSLLLATKAGVIVADAASSGLVREGHCIDDWINEKVHEPEIGTDDIAEAVITPRADQISRQKCKPFELHPFQTRTAQQGSRVLLLAACAAGKTLAAWKWAEAQAREKEIGKVIFLYPTRGTATEGFRDYVGWAPEAEGALVHGTSRFELEAMASNPSEATEGKSHGLNESEERLFALALWSRRYFSATVDQFLGFMEHNYTALCLLPLLADSALIIDEIHSFDRRMFDSLIAFLRMFDLPVLCMTATLPTSRREELINAGLTIYPSSDDRAELESLEMLERHPRYQHEPVKDAGEALVRAIEAYRKGERVLWVVNTVSRCQELATRLEQELGVNALTYHSRFKLTDRQRVHTATVAAFQQMESAAIAVTTQVCEMSLDLDADVLITEVAPISSLVQRFGRANRHLARGMDFRAILHTYYPERSLPYAQEEIQAATSFLKKIGSAAVSQRDMADLLEELSLKEREADGSARFLDGGYFATRGAFRDTDDFTHPCILNSDLEQVKASIDERKPYDGFIVGVPKRFADMSETKPSWLPKYLGIANAEFYSPDRGFIAG